MIFNLFFLFIPLASHRLVEPQSLIIPAQPNANSQAYLRSNNVSSYSIHAGNRTSCRFKAAVIPCECIMEVSDDYTLEENGVELQKFAVGPPEVTVQVPSTHELLQELNVFIDPKLCKSVNYRLQVHHRTVETAPGESVVWSLIYSVISILHNQRVTVRLPCNAFADEGVYRVEAVSESNYSIFSNEVLVNASSSSNLVLRNDSIFPHCTANFAVSWTTARCPAAKLQYRLRVLAVPEGSIDHEDRAMYLEEISLERGEHSLSISCSQFDIIYEKYCFELVSVNKNSSSFYLWNSLCVSSEPVARVDGGWSQWSSWSDCSASCGTGTQRRSRTCDSPSPVRGKSCKGNVLETSECSLASCPEAARSRLPSTNCSCGCLLEGSAGSFFATSSAHQACSGNQTWWLSPFGALSMVDFAVARDPGARGRLFFFLGAPYGELLWFSGSNQEPAFTLRVEKPVYVVLWSKENATNAADDHKGFTVVYSRRAPEPPAQLAQRPTLACHPFCPETMIISLLGVLFMLIIFIPPFICANITQKMRRNSSPDLPLLEKNESEMIRSGNTECTQISNNKTQYVAKRSIGIQLSVQNTPRLPRTGCPSVDSPLPRGASSLSASDELEYDYYDGTTIPGSLLAPIDDVMLSQIDIDHIISQSSIFAGHVPKQDVHTQI